MQDPHRSELSTGIGPRPHISISLRPSPLSAGRTAETENPVVSMVENAAARKLAGTRPFPPQRSGLPNMQLPGPPERRLRAGQKDRCVGVISGEQQVLQLLPSRPPSPRLPQPPPSPFFAPAAAVTAALSWHEIPFAPLSAIVPPSAIYLAAIPSPVALNQVSSF